MKTLYTAEATVTGEGRDGHARSSDGVLDPSGVPEVLARVPVA